jgi:hypothetical protein
MASVLIHRFDAPCATPSPGVCGCIPGAQVGFRFDKPCAIPTAFIPAREPRSQNCLCDSGGVLAEKIPGEFCESEGGGDKLEPGIGNGRCF